MPPSWRRRRPRLRPPSAHRCPCRAQRRWSSRASTTSCSPRERAYGRGPDGSVRDLTMAPLPSRAHARTRHPQPGGACDGVTQPSVSPSPGFIVIAYLPFPPAWALTSTVGDAAATGTAGAASAAVFAAVCRRGHRGLGVALLGARRLPGARLRRVEHLRQPRVLRGQRGFFDTAMRNSAFTSSSSVMGDFQAMASWALTYASHASVGSRSARQPRPVLRALTTDEAGGADAPRTVE